MKWERFSPVPKIINLYGYWRSSASWRVRWALEIKQIPFNYIPVNLLTGENKSPEHLARSPMGSLPVFETETGKFLSESMAIIEWIEEVFSLKGPVFFPGTPWERAKIRELCEIINSDTAPLQTPRVQKRHSADAAEQKLWAQDFMRSGLKVFDESSKALRGKFSFQNDLTAADLFLVPQIYNALRFELPVESEFPALFQIYQECRALPSCIKSAPESMPDCPPSAGIPRQ